MDRKLTSLEDSRISAFQAPPRMTEKLWQSPQKNCKNCPYCNQDVDTYPCAQCHTRH